MIASGCPSSLCHLLLLYIFSVHIPRAQRAQLQVRCLPKYGHTVAQIVRSSLMVKLVKRDRSSLDEHSAYLSASQASHAAKL